MVRSQDPIRHHIRRTVRHGVMVTRPRTQNFGQSYSDHRALPNPHQRGAPLLEHPARKLQSRRRRADASAATKHVATRLLDHLLNLNNASRRRLPPIQNLALFGCVGVLSPRSTITGGSIRRCDISAQWPSRKYSWPT